MGVRVPHLRGTGSRFIITHLSTCPNQNLPTDSADEANDVLPLDRADMTQQVGVERESPARRQSVRSLRPASRRMQKGGRAVARVPASAQSQARLLPSTLRKAPAAGDANAVVTACLADLGIPGCEISARPLRLADEPDQVSDTAFLNKPSVVFPKRS